VTSTWDFATEGVDESHAPFTNWALVTSPSRIGGFTPATVYVEVLVLVVGGLRTSLTVCSGTTTSCW